MLLILLGTAAPTLNPTGVLKMELIRAEQIVNKMVKERYSTVDKVLAEFIKWQVDGEVKHFWPDENTACMMLLNRRVEK